MKLVSYPFFSLANIIDHIANRRFSLPVNVDKDIRIFVFQHFETILPECFANSSIYVPIQCGRALHESMRGTIGDDTEPSISSLNPFLNEMTAIYWIGKHYHEVGNPEYVGFAHYRRCLDWAPSLLTPGVVFASTFVSRVTNRCLFVSCHGEKWLDLFMKRFRSEFCECRDIDDFWDSHFMYIANNFITDRKTFLRYFAFVERCLRICEELIAKHKLEFNVMSISMKRQFSFIMERMTSYWIWHEKRKKSIAVISSRLKCYAIDNNMTAVR